MNPLPSTRDFCRQKRMIQLESFTVGLDFPWLGSGMGKIDEDTSDEHSEKRENGHASLVDHEIRVVYWPHSSALSCTTSENQKEYRRVRKCGLLSKLPVILCSRAIPRMRLNPGCQKGCDSQIVCREEPLPCRARVLLRRPT